MSLVLACVVLVILLAIVISVLDPDSPDADEAIGMALLLFALVLAGAWAVRIVLGAVG